MKRFASIALAAVLAAGILPAVAVSVQIDDNLTSPIAALTPSGDYIIYADRAQAGEVLATSLKAYNTKTGQTIEFAKDCKPAFGSDATYLASDKFFCYVDTRDTNGAGYNNIFAWSTGSSKSNYLFSRPVPPIKMAVVRSTLVWLEPGERMSIWVKSLESNADPVLAAEIATNAGSDASIYAFTYKNVDYIVFEDRSNAKTSIRLYNISTMETLTVSDTDFVETSPRYQAGNIFFIKGRSFDPYNPSMNLGGTIECYSIDQASTKTVYEFDGTMLPALVSNMRNPSSFIFTLTNRMNGKFTCMRYDLASESAFEAFSVEGSFIAIQPESCNVNVICYSQFSSPVRSKLKAIDSISKTSYDISHANESEMLVGYSESRFFFTSMVLTPSPNPMAMVITDIKLSAWTIGQ